MTQDDRFASLKARLEDLEDKLEKKTAEFGDTRRLKPHHRQQAEDIRLRARDLRGRLGGPQPTNWQKMEREMEADWESLMNAFGRWVRHVDEEYLNPRA